ncbi:rhomboid family protein [Blautia sp.]|uniref:Rhomboid protease GluP n=1 Tax=Blautia glucerasea TaxID=536633 RepID=A0A6N2T1R0_9FIRM
MEEFRKEPATIILVVLNALVFLAVEFTGFSQDTVHMLDWGAAYTPCIVEEGETYRIFTSMFLHFGIEHLINNMLVLFVLGSRLERVIGSLRFAVIYFLGGIAGNVVSLLYDLKQGEAAVSAGASGAVFAVMGGMILVVLCNKGRLEDLSMRQILILAVFSLYFGFTSSGVDNAAHLGGFLAGFILAVIVYHPRRKT